ncbi:Major facilitator superfamily transporter [Pseudomonas syringae pv. cilantro]|uniref:Major facilitator superfamily transporter n=2 Tax=Pseudomonas syringae group TaxID=136849 RepID=A0A0N0GCL7_PSESX|nr:MULTISPECIES: MFS transporter [Pseudomonas syringae group]KPC24172.1 Major facilitator superfamily transporter [Pseudomonas syringae pv. cilantro]KPW78174.1 Major facilitator superfamily transporter [Pseudomonas syringae pv. coriandricola]RMN11172.1 Major facilitator superfamily transporter [Pseudomonas syringae pv. coriandricola]
MKLFHPIYFLALGLFGVYTIEFGVVGILPVIIERFSITASQAGLLVGLFALVIAVFGPVMVLLLSRFNRKKMLTLALFIFAVTSVLSAYAPSFESLMALRIIPALFHPVYFSLAFVAAISLYPPQESTRAASKAFIGTSMGMVLGVPLTTLIAAQFSYETSFLFCAAVNCIAGLGIIARLPDAPDKTRISYGEQLAILRKFPLWLNITAATLIFAAMFSVYSYSAEYLAKEAGMSAQMISILLVIFGIGGVAGNLYAGKLIGQNMVRTTILHPILLACAYGLLFMFAGPSLMTMIVIVVVWGATHTSGLIVTQIWLTSEAPEAPEFATGIYISFINLGVTIGSTTGGWFLARMGLQGTLYSGLLFAALALLVIVVKVLFFSVDSPKASAQTATD